MAEVNQASYARPSPTATDKRHSLAAGPASEKTLPPSSTSADDMRDIRERRKRESCSTQAAYLGLPLSLF